MNKVSLGVVREKLVLFWCKLRKETSAPTQNFLNSLVAVKKYIFSSTWETMIRKMLGKPLKIRLLQKMFAAELGVPVAIAAAVAQQHSYWLAIDGSRRKPVLEPAIQTKLCLTAFERNIEMTQSITVFAAPSAVCIEETKWGWEEREEWEKMAWSLLASSPWILLIHWQFVTVKLLCELRANASFDFLFSSFILTLVSFLMYSLL